MPDDPIIAQLEQPIAPRQPGVFRLGLVLNGTVSAGAWTAGVLDFLFQALDLWEAAKRQDRQNGGPPTVPDHAVRLDVAGGASGGGVCAGLLARAAGWQFRAVQRADDPANANNPFWKVWVETLDVTSMLDTLDLDADGAVPVSLLSGTAIDLAGEVILKWPQAGANPARRSWIADPLHVLMTLTNLRGVPYRVTMQQDMGGAPNATYYVDHADHVLFAFPFADGVPIRRGDALAVRDARDWQQVAEFAKATGAFPAGLPPRRVARRVSDYDWRAAVLPGESGQPPRVVRRVPAWDILDAQLDPQDEYLFDCVDGGAINNQPVELVRTALAGLGKSNPRDPKLADAAVLLLDPFATVPRCLPPIAQQDLLGVAAALLGSLTDQGRFNTSDLLLSLDEDVFSRFLLTASRMRDGKLRYGDDALATAGLGAFLGFFCRDLRVHDFMLGRENCRAFLMNEFVLDKDNPLFNGLARRAPNVAADFQVADGGDWLPVIPVLPPLRAAQPVPGWPAGKLGPETRRTEIQARAGLLLHRLLEYHQIGFAFDGVAIGILKGKIADAAEKQIQDAVSATGLG